MSLVRNSLPPQGTPGATASTSCCLLAPLAWYHSSAPAAILAGAVVRLWPFPRRPGNIPPMASYVSPRAPMGSGAGERGAAASVGGGGGRGEERRSRRRGPPTCPGAAVDPGYLALLSLPSPFWHRGTAQEQEGGGTGGNWRSGNYRTPCRTPFLVKMMLTRFKVTASTPLRPCADSEVSPGDLWWQPPVFITRSMGGGGSDDDGSDKWNSGAKNPGGEEKIVLEEWMIDAD